MQAGLTTRRLTFREVFLLVGRRLLSEIRVLVLSDFRLPVDVVEARMPVTA